MLMIGEYIVVWLSTYEQSRANHSLSLIMNICIRPQPWRYFIIIIYKYEAKKIKNLGCQIEWNSWFIRCLGFLFWMNIAVIKWTWTWNRDCIFFISSTSCLTLMKSSFRTIHKVFFVKARYPTTFNTMMIMNGQLIFMIGSCRKH